MAGLLQKPRSLLPLLIGGSALLAFLAIMLYGLLSGRTGGDNQPIPLLKPEVPVKSATDGLHIRPEPHRDITVFDVFDENNTPAEDEVNLLESTEELQFTKAFPAKDDIKQVDITQIPVKPAEKPVAQVTQPAQPVVAPPKAVQAPPKAVKPAPKVVSQQVQAGHYIQLAAFADKLSAENNWNALKDKHQDILAQAPHFVQIWRDTKNDKVFYRLLIGPYDNKKTADDLCDRLQKLSQNCFTRRL